MRKHFSVNLFIQYIFSIKEYINITKNETFLIAECVNFFSLSFTLDVVSVCVQLYVYRVLIYKIKIAIDLLKFNFFIFH